jgi:hypothetical protein
LADQTQHHADCDGLTRLVAAEKSVNFARAIGQVDAVHGADIAKMLGHPAGFND